MMFPLPTPGTMLYVSANVCRLSSDVPVLSCVFCHFSFASCLRWRSSRSSRRDSGRNQDHQDSANLAARGMTLQREPGGALYADDDADANADADADANATGVERALELWCH